MKWKLLPYIFIVGFSTLVAIIRFLLIPQWSITMHLVVYILQVLFLAIIWSFIKYLSNILDRYFPFEKSPARRIIVQVILAFLFITPVYLLFIFNIDRFRLPFMNTQFLAITSMLFFVFILLLNLGHNAFYFFRQWQKSVEEKAALEIHTASMEREKSISQYQRLKNQVNPHFLFNTLTSLDGLIGSDPELASKFVRHLSKVYRYVLEHAENEVVTVQTEIDFIDHYIAMLKLKHDGALQINLDVSAEAREKGIAMVTLQMLIDNAIKHNMVHPKTPLVITIRDEEDFLTIQNNKQLRKQIELSTKQGLQHLRQLYAFLDKKPVIVVDEPFSFNVKLPLL